MRSLKIDDIEGAQPRIRTNKRNVFQDEFIHNSLLHEDEKILRQSQLGIKMRNPGNSDFNFDQTDFLDHILMN